MSMGLFANQALLRAAALGLNQTWYAKNTGGELSYVMELKDIQTNSSKC